MLNWHCHGAVQTLKMTNTFKDEAMKLPLASLLIGVLLGANAHAAGTQTSQTPAPSSSTCTGTYPSYFQDPAFTKTGMWDNQVIINQAYPGWKGPIFQLSDAYSAAKADQQMPWLKFNPFDKNLSETIRKISQETIDPLIEKGAKNTAIIVLKEPENEIIAMIGSVALGRA